MKFLRALTAAALFAALFVLVLPVHADCGDGDPSCLLEPPISVEIRTASNSGDASGATAESSALAPLDFALPMPLPRRVEAPSVSAQSEPNSTGSVPDFASLSIPMRYQDPQDVSCGAQALGMALDGLGGSAPSSSSLWNFLEGQGMTYDFGTGVEELAHAAQNFGYGGSLPFHGWSLDQLMATLAEGKPVVVALGANGEGEPGHFVTMTGISADGNWVSYNDPTLGKQVISAAEFERLWSMQGSSGVSVAKAIPAGAPGGYAPWVALAAGLMALVSTTPVALQRKGIGGVLLHDGSTGGSTGNPPYAAPSGYRWKRKLVTKYKTVWVQDGWTYENRTVPRYEKQRVQVGTTTVYDKIPQYKTMRVQDGWKTVYDRVAQYKNVRYVRYYRTTRKRVKRYRYYRGRRYFAGYSYVTRRTPVYGTRRVFNGYKKVYKRVPNYVNRRVFSHYKVIETEVPKYEWQDVRVGWTTEKVRVPKMVQVRKPDGTEVRWELEKLPEPPMTPTPTPETTPSPTSTPRPERPPTPEATGTPFPPVFGQSFTPGTHPACVPGWTSDIPSWISSGKDAVVALGISTRVVDDLGHLGVSGSQGARALTDLHGTFYNPSTVARTVGGSVLRNSVSKTSILTAVAASLTVNYIDYKYGCESNKGLDSPEFFASTIVDIGTSLLVGAAAALTIGIITATVGAVFSVAIPAVLVIAGAALLGAWFGNKIESTGAPDRAKAALTNYIKSENNLTLGINGNPPPSTLAGYTLNTDANVFSGNSTGIYPPGN